MTMYRTPRRKLNSRTWISAEFGLHVIGEQAPYMSLTGVEWSHATKDQVSACGQIPDLISKAFPELAEVAKWHLCTDGEPMHYIANARFWWEAYHYVRARQAHEPDPRNAFASTIHAGVLEGESREWADALITHPWPEVKFVLEVRLPPMREAFHKVVAGLPELARSLNVVEVQS